ncbi:MAG: 30S ribosomal protein S13 [bacterium]|nr:30S ribosomal protein S13 [bacterium]
MFRVQGHVLPDKKIVRIALTMVYGVGRSRSKKILDQLNIPLEKKVNDLSEKEQKDITEAFKIYVLENDLRRQVGSDIKRLKEIKCYRGMRHNLGLPVRGQSTLRHARTAKKLLGRAKVRPVIKK